MTSLTMCANCNRAFERESMLGFRDTFDNDVSLADLVADIFLRGDKTNLYENAPVASVGSYQLGKHYVGFKLCKLCVDMLMTCFKCRQDFLESCNPDGFIRTILDVHDVSKVIARDVKLEAEPEDVIDSSETFDCEVGADDIGSPVHMGMEDHYDSQQLAISIRSEAVKRKQELYKRYGLKHCSVVLNQLSASKICKVENECWSGDDDDEKIRDPVEIFNCNLCMMTFSHKAKLILHIQFDHVTDATTSKPDRFDCRLCPKSFSNRSVLLRHTYLHTKEIRNKRKRGSHKKDKDVSSDSRDVLISENSEETFSCTECDSSFCYDALRIVHTQFDHRNSNEISSNYFCSMCPNVYPYRSMLVEHMFAHTKEKRFVCRVKGCRYFSARFRTVKTHIKKKHKLDDNYSPPVKKWKRTSKSDEEQSDSHERRKGSDFESAEDSLKSLNLDSTDLIARVEGSYNCEQEQCLQTFRHKAVLMMHTQFDHCESNQKALEKYCCWLCPKVYSNRCSLQDHMFFHSKENKFICRVKQCKFSTVTVKSLRSHMEEMHLLTVKKRERSTNMALLAQDVRINCSDSEREDNNNFLCEHCGKIFKFEAIRILHIQFDHRDPNLPTLEKFCCQQCPKAYEYRRGLLEHTFTHTNEKFYVCHMKGCKFYTANTAKFKTHMRKNHQNAKTKRGTKTNPIRKQLDTNSKVAGSSINAFKCDQCRKSFLFKAKLLLHAQFDHCDPNESKPEKFFCKQCPVAYRFRCNLLNHMFTHTGEEKLRCREDGCMHLFSTTKGLECHMEIKHKIACDSSATDNASNAMSRMTQEQSETNEDIIGTAPIQDYLTCNRCEKTFVHKAMRIVHDQFDHRDSLPENYSCSMCPKFFKYRSALVSHMFFHTKEKRFVCRVKHCNFFSGSVTNVKMHMKSAHKVVKVKKRNFQNQLDESLDMIDPEAEESTTSFNCEHCHETFRHKAELMLHTQFDHQGSNEGTPEKYCCSVCPNVYSRRSFLLTHMFSHTQENKFRCRLKQCKYFSLDPTKVKMHMLANHNIYIPPFWTRDQTHHSSETVDTDTELVTTFNCEQCTEIFAHKALLIMHNQFDHRSSDEQGSECPTKYECLTCGIVYKTRNGLLEHTFTHTQEKRYMCHVRICQYVSNNLTTLNLHCREVHPNEMRIRPQTNSASESINGLPNTSVSKPAKGRKPMKLKCRFKNCSSIFNFQATLLSHTATVHLPRQCLNMFQCYFCDMVMTSTDEVDQHMFLHTAEGVQDANKEVNLFSIEGVLIADCKLKEDPSKCIPGGKLPFVKHNQQYYCIVCAFVHKRFSKFSNHFQTHTKQEFLCHLCAKVFTHHQSLKHHYRDFHNSTDISPGDTSWKKFCKPLMSTNSFSCDVPNCEAKFSFQADLLFHNLKDHQNNTWNSTTEGIIHCPLCDYKTVHSNIHNMRFHFFKHTGEDLFGCTVPSCNYQTHYPQRIKIHIRTNHAELCS